MLSRTTEPAAMGSDDVASDDYMIARGFVKLTARESRYYSHFFELADRHGRAAIAEHLFGFWAQTKRLFGAKPVVTVRENRRPIRASRPRRQIHRRRGLLSGGSASRTSPKR